MYEELVKRLRAVVGGGREEKCDGCPYEEDYPCCVDCLDKLHKQAADAIEDLQKLTDTQLDIVKQYQVYLTKHRWIPVTDQLIHSGWYLVACNEWAGSAVRKAIYDIVTRRWLEFPCRGPKDITKFVTHYMPLPEPPKEEKT